MMFCEFYNILQIRPMHCCLVWAAFAEAVPKERAREINTFFIKWNFILIICTEKAKVYTGYVS